MHEEPTPLDRVASAIQAYVEFKSEIPFFIGWLPSQIHEFISLSRGQSQGVLYGYGGLAYIYTSINIVCRSTSYEGVENLVTNVVDSLISQPNMWISAFSPAQVKNAGDVECIEITLTIDTLERA